MSLLGEKVTEIPCEYCFIKLFENCDGLLTAPELPATTLAENCYNHMFKDCTSLTSAPELPATTLADYCYYLMFQGCTSLTNAPSILPATTLANSCYYGMFQGCTNLNYIKVDATSWNTSYTYNWVYNVASTGTFVKPSGTSIPTGHHGVPEGWTVENV